MGALPRDETTATLIFSAARAGTTSAGQSSAAASTTATSTTNLLMESPPTNTGGKLGYTAISWNGCGEPRRDRISSALRPSKRAALKSRATKRTRREQGGWAHGQSGGSGRSRRRPAYRGKARAPALLLVAFED